MTQILERIEQGGESIVYFQKDIGFTETKPKGGGYTWDFIPEIPHLYLLEKVLGMNKSRFINSSKNKKLRMLHQQVMTQYKTFTSLNIDIEGYSILDIVRPLSLLEDYYQERSSEVWNKVRMIESQPKALENWGNHVVKLASEVTPLNLDFENVSKAIKEEENFKKLREKYEGKEVYLEYNPEGTITGRMTSMGFPFLNLTARYRGILKKRGDGLLSIDFNAFEARVYMAICNKEQIKGDLYNFLIEKEGTNRDRREMKGLVLKKWLNSDEKNRSYLDQNIKKIFEEYFPSDLTPFLRKKKKENGEECYILPYYDREVTIVEDNEIKTRSHIIQTMASSIMQEKVLELIGSIVGMRSYFVGMIHDCFLLDVYREEKSQLIDLFKKLELTSFGHFPLGIQIGHNWGDLRPWNY